jgi:hypothetical protein
VGDRAGGYWLSGRRAGGGVQRAILAACMDSVASAVEPAARVALQRGLPEGAAPPVLDALARNSAEPQVRERSRRTHTHNREVSWAHARVHTPPSRGCPSPTTA